jgi:hypothetical protein
MLVRKKQGQIVPAIVDGVVGGGLDFIAMVITLDICISPLCFLYARTYGSQDGR